MSQKDTDKKILKFQQPTHITIEKCQAPERYTKIHNDAVEDVRLSADGLALLTWFMKQPPTFDMDPSKITKRFGWEIKKIRKLFNELKDLGYMLRIRTRHEDGTLGNCLTKVSDEPKFLALQPTSQKGTLEPESQIGTLEPRSQKPTGGFGDVGSLYIKETVIKETNKQIITTTNQDTARDPEPSADVVVDLDNELVKGLKKRGVNPHDAMQYVRNYGEARTKEVIQLCDEKPRDNPAGFIAAAFRKGWTIGEKTKSEARSATKQLPTKDEVIQHVKTSVWPNLSDLEKIEKLEYARDINLVFDHMFKHSNLTAPDVLLTSFMDSGVFRFMVEILYPNHG